MIELEPGQLYCTTPALTKALGVTEKVVRSIYYNRREDFSPIRLQDYSIVPNKDAHTFLQEHKSELNLSRIRPDLLLWPEQDAFVMATLSRSAVGRAFRKDLWQFCKNYVTRNYVTIEQYQHIAGLYEEQNSRIESLERAFGVDIGFQASEAGRKLAHTRHLRVVN